MLGPDITVATTVWGAYGRFLGEWAASVAGQTVPPSAVVIAELGGCAAEADAAATLIRSRGIAATVVSEPFHGMGHARNTAVAVSSTEWVMHLDADDLLLPGALEMVSPLTEQADVISMSARYSSGRVRGFPRVSARTILAGQVQCLSCSPFRRSLWERSPYQTLPGPLDYVDALLWVGFARLGARFTWTREPGFTYRQHSGSFRRTLTPPQLAAARRHIRRVARFG